MRTVRLGKTDNDVSDLAVGTGLMAATGNSPIRLARKRTEECPSKCGVVKKGDPRFRIKASISTSESTQITATSV